MAAALLLAAAGLLIWMAVTDAQRSPLSAHLWKSACSLFLVPGAVPLVREITNIRAEARAGIGGFEFARHGKPDTIRAEALRAMIVQRHSQINGSFRR